jgi:hypothetical protein
MKLLNRASNGWSDSDPDSNEKYKKGDNYMPKSLAVRDKFVYDPEHGGGRRRRNKHLPRQKVFTDNSDRINYNNKDLNKQF